MAQKTPGKIKKKKNPLNDIMENDICLEINFRGGPLQRAMCMVIDVFLNCI